MPESKSHTEPVGIQFPDTDIRGVPDADPEPEVKPEPIESEPDEPEYDWVAQNQGARPPQHLR